MRTTDITAQVQNDLRAIEETLDDECAGLLGVAARFLPTAETVFYNADTVFPTASTIKIAIVETLVRQKADFAQPVTIGASDHVGGSGVLATLAPGLTLPLGDLATLTLSVSDNTASNLCLKAAGGPSAVNTFLHDIVGATQTVVHRPIRFALREGDAPHTATGTPRDFLRLLGHVSEPTRERLAMVSDGAMLPRFLPINPYAALFDGEDLPYSVAHKTGGVTGVRADVGFITRGRKTLQLAVFTKGCRDERWTPENQGVLAVAKVAETLVHRFFETA